MNGGITFKQTSAVKDAADAIRGDNYGDIISELENIKKQIVNNWEGDTNDINDIITRLDQIIAVFGNKINPAVTQLGQSSYYFAEQVEKIAATNTATSGKTNGTSSATTTSNSNKHSGGGGNFGNGGSTNTSSTGTEQSKDTEKKEDPGFWKRHADDFANDWDYTGVDGVFSAMGATVSGTCGTIGSSANFLIDGAGELLKWIFD